MTTTLSPALKYVGKYVSIEVDSFSWSPASAAPVELFILDGTSKKMSVGVALLHTALRTRPPVSTGIHLADYWAWMRYGTAIDSDPHLGLRYEWKHIDPHQKTVLSDDLGMGFTTYLLSQVLKFKAFADTIHFVKVAHPGRFKFSEYKNGKFKSPDFVAMDSTLNPGSISVVECKGTQGSKGGLINALKDGVLQKSNISLASGSTSKINHKLVAGLYIPLRRNGSAVIRICDPEYGELAEAFEGIPTERLEPAVVQIDLAKNFALMGLHSIARTLATTNTAERNTLPEFNYGEVESLLPGSNQNELVFTTDNLLPSDMASFGDVPVRRSRFTMRCQRSLYASLIESTNLQNTFERFVRDAKGREWEERFSEDGNGATLVTPLGFTLTLEYLPQ
jgi:hypothetical protein